METIQTPPAPDAVRLSREFTAPNARKAFVTTLAALVASTPSAGVSKEPLWRQIFGYREGARPKVENVVPAPKKETATVNAPKHKTKIEEPAPTQPEADLPGNKIAIVLDEKGHPYLTSNGDSLMPGDVYEYIPSKDGKGGVAVVHAGYNPDKTPIKRYLHLDARTFTILSGEKYGLLTGDISRGTPPLGGYKPPRKAYVDQPKTRPQFAPK